MDIDQFQEEVTDRACYTDGRGNPMSAEELHIYLTWDGYLSATYRGEAIPCESARWADSLGIIADTIRVWDHIE